MNDYIPMVCNNCDDGYDAKGEPVCFIERVEVWSKQVKVGVYLKCVNCGDYGEYDYRWIMFGRMGYADGEDA